MKKIILLLIAIIGATFAMAQERIVVLNSGRVIDATTQAYAYDGYTSDRLIPVTRDTIDYIVLVKNQDISPLQFYANFTLDTVDGADTTVSIQVDYKMFNSQSYSTLISAAWTSEITGLTQVAKTTIGVIASKTYTTASAVDLFRGSNITNNDTLTVSSRVMTYLDNPALYYRYLRFRLIIRGNDHIGAGIQIKRIELQFLK